MDKLNGSIDALARGANMRCGNATSHVKTPL
jgi:hypothetical protein